jgi:hypothetical protein
MSQWQRFPEMPTWRLSFVNVNLCSLCTTPPTGGFISCPQGGARIRIDSPPLATSFRVLPAKSLIPSLFPHGLPVCILGIAMVTSDLVSIIKMQHARRCGPLLSSIGD